MKKITFIILGSLAFLSCGETVYRENNYMFQLPQKDVFVKTSRREICHFFRTRFFIT